MDPDQYQGSTVMKKGLLHHEGLYAGGWVLSWSSGMSVNGEDGKHQKGSAKAGR